MAVVELKESEWREFKNTEYSIIDCYGEDLYEMGRSQYLSTIK